MNKERTQNLPNIRAQAAKVEADLARLSQDESDVDPYDMNHKRRGQFLIINNKTFDPKTYMNERNGTDVDAKYLSEDFEKLGFKVAVHNNKTAAEMLQLMITASSEDHSDCDCFGVAVLTHGEKDVIYGVDNVISIDDFVNPMKNCKSLAGKPKIFIFQACRGYQTDAGVDVVDGNNQLPEKLEKSLRIPLEADFIYVYSTVPGYYSWRNIEKGSWFVQALHDVLQKKTRGFDFIKLLTRVSKEIAYTFVSEAQQQSMNLKKQVPSVVSMLTKDLIINEKASF